MASAIRFASAAAALALLAGFAQAQELVTNGGFETGDFTGWTTTPASNDSWFGITSFGHSGQYSSYFAATGFQDDSISQMLGTSAGQQYTISFYYLGFSGNANHLGVWWEGQNVFNTPGGVDDDGSGWLHVTLSVTATGNGSELRFGAYDVPGFSELDDISVTPAPGAAAVLGLGGLAMTRRRR